MKQEICVIEVEEKNPGQVVKFLNPKEVVLLTKVYCCLDFPHVSITLNDAMRVLKCSKMTARKILNGLVERGLLVFVRDFISFYYPLKNGLSIRRSLFEEMGVGKL